MFHVVAFLWILFRAGSAGGMETFKGVLNAFRAVGAESTLPVTAGAVVLAGMGGTLMTRMLDRCDIPINGAGCIVLQPMRAQADIRSYLYNNCYWIVDDRIVPERGRLYQIFRAEPNVTKQPIPEGFPHDFFDIGYRSFAQRDPYLAALCKFQHAQHQKQLKTAAGTEGESKLAFRIDALNRILNQLTE